MAQATKSLKARGSDLTSAERQFEVIGRSSERLQKLPRFGAKLKEIGLLPLRATGIEIFQINIGKMCNQTCKHCHVDAGPDRKEMMSRGLLEKCLEILSRHPIPTVDITGGAPEMHPEFRWFVERLSKLGKKIIDRCNLTILTANQKYRDLPEFFKKNGVTVVSSLPYYQKGFTDRQRGDGVFDKSITGLRMLNDVGYGKPGTGLELNLVYNPAGAFLPGAQAELEATFKKELRALFGIEFNALYAITNMPISRYLDYLQASDNLDDYMSKLVQAFNPTAALGVMCRNTVSVGWDGLLYDCDFNQQLDLKVQGTGTRLENFDFESLAKRTISVDQHCYGCTAGSGSSCGGTVT